MVGSGTPPGAISCTRRFPREAIRIVAWMGPSISGLGGSVVTEPVHVPARLFKAANETSASDFAGIASCPGGWFCAKVSRHNDNAAILITDGSDFTWTSLMPVQTVDTTLPNRLTSQQVSKGPRFPRAYPIRPKQSNVFLESALAHEFSL